MEGIKTNLIYTLYVGKENKRKKKKENKNKRKIQ